MLPVLFMEQPGRLVQLTMMGSVGFGGLNNRTDVILVQTLLNAVSVRDGGPPIKLVVDGIAGPKTIAAIRGYQKAQGKIADGRVDVGGPTIVTMVRKLIARNCLPSGLPNIERPAAEIVQALLSYTNASTSFKGDPVMPPGRPRTRGWSPAELAISDERLGLMADDAENHTGLSGWNIVNAGGVGLSVLLVGVATFTIYMTHDTEKTKAGKPMDYGFTFAGAGVGISSLPIGFDISGKDMPFFGGTELFKDPVSPPLVRASDLVNKPATVVCLSGSAGLGMSETNFTIGGVPGRGYWGSYAGSQVGMPGLAATIYLGTIAGFS